MELLEGETLQQRFTRGVVDWPTFMDLALAIADALDAAHHSGVIHRDIKPANIFLTPHGQSCSILDSPRPHWEQQRLATRTSLRDRPTRY
jgi:serine/threonine protein kinase